MKDKYNHAHIVFILHHFIMLEPEYFSVIRHIQLSIYAISEYFANKLEILILLQNMF